MKSKGGKRSPLNKALDNTSRTVADDNEEELVGSELTQVSSSKSLLDIEPQKQLFVRLMMRYTYAARVAKMLGINRITAQGWAKEEWYRKAYQAALDEMVSDPIKVFGPMLPEAIQTYHEKLRQRDRETAKDVFDHIHGKPPAHSTSIGDYTINIVIKKASKFVDIDAEVVE